MQPNLPTSKSAASEVAPSPVLKLARSWAQRLPASGGEARARRSALALAEAIIPGTERIMAADEVTVAGVEELLGELHPQASRLWRLAQRALDAAAVSRTGHFFHTLSAERQQELLGSWQRDPVLRAPLALTALLLKMVHFDRLDVYTSLGGKRNVVTKMEQPRYLEQIQPAADWREGDIDCDVVVVGTGAGGAIVGRELAERGHAVVFLEEGDHHRRDSFDGSIVAAHRTFYRFAISVGNVVMPIFMGRLLGGSTAINTGTAFRTPPWVLERWCEEMDTDAFGSENMGRYFDRVERTLNVETARREIIGPIADFMGRGCDAHGWQHAALRRNAAECDGKGFCNFGCRTDARKSAQLSYLPKALEKGALALTGARVDKVLVEGGRATGVEVQTSSGRRLQVRAKAVVLAGGAIPTPLLLQRQGLANRSGQVGRNLSLHPSSGVVAIAKEEIRPSHYTPQGYASEEFLRDGIMIIAAQPDVNVTPVILADVGHPLMEMVEQQDHLASMGVMIRDSRAGGRVRAVPGGSIITYDVTHEDIDRMHRGMVRTSQLAFAAGAKRVHPLLMGGATLHSIDELEKFKKRKVAAKDLVLSSYHPLGTCKMGRDPKTSVVDLDHQSHDVKGLFITDGSTVSGPLGVNPQVTIMAMATRAAERIADHL